VTKLIIPLFCKLYIKRAIIHQNVGIFFAEHGKAVKLVIVHDYSSMCVS
jgi:hypothetical protein